MLQETLIDSVDVSSYVVNWEYERTYGDAISQATIKILRNSSLALTLQEGQTVSISRGWTLPTDENIFNGYIESFEPSGGSIIIIAKDKLWDAVRKEVTHVYDKDIDASAGKISEIFKDLIETYAGLTASVQDSGTTIILDKFVCNHTDIYERCKALADILEWQFYYKSDTDTVYFEPKGFTPNTTVLTVGDNVISVPKWTHDVTEMVNDLTVVGAYQEIETTESGRIGTTAGYTTADVLLNFTPISVKMYNDNSNPPTTLKVGGLIDSTGTFDYYVDKNQKKLFPSPTAGTFANNSYVEVRYSHAVPIPVHLTDALSIATYGQFKKTITFKDLRSVADAEQRGNNYLTNHAIPYLMATLKVKSESTYNLKNGDTISVVDTINEPNVSQSFVISRVRDRYPADYVEIVVGDKAFRQAEWQSSVEERLKRIMEDELANQDIVVEIQSFDNSINPIKFENRYFSAYQQSFAGEVLIWGNLNFGTWGTQYWGNATTLDLIWDTDLNYWDDNYWALQQTAFILGNNLFGILGTSKLGGTGTAEILNVMQQYNNTYTETFYDDDFKDLAITNATWSNANKWLSFTSGQIAQSTSIDYNNSTITSATLTATVSSGTFTYQMTADGTNWETVTNGVAHTFTNTGIDLRWKITENASGTGRITQIIVSNYH